MSLKLKLVILLLSLSVFGGCEKVDRERVGKLEQENFELREENATIKKLLSERIVQAQGVNFLSLNCAFALVILSNVIWCMVYFRRKQIWEQPSRNIL